jgi:hypothetical protein
MASSDNPTVIFILGLPFSGSTLAAAALGSSENVFNCGEVSYVEKDWKPRRPCSCGQQLDLCPHWTAIRAEMRANSAQGLPGLGLEENGRLHRLDARSRPLGETLAYLFNRPLERIYDGGDLKKYAADHAAFFRAVARHTGAKYIVDASKNPRRLEALLDHSDLPIKIIHWQRSPATVFGARIKRARRRDRLYFSGLAPLYVLWMIAQKRAVARVIRRVKPDDLLPLQLEEMLASPQIFAGKVSDFLDDPIVPSIDDEQGLSLDRTHVLSGNIWLLRQAGGKRSVVLRQPLDRPELNWFEAALFRLASLILQSLKANA